MTRSWTQLVIVSVVFTLTVALLFKFTLKKVKLKYPLTSPTEQPDVYTGKDVRKTGFKRS